MSGRVWSKREDELLAQWYGKIDTPTIAREFKRSEGAVWQRARVLGLAERTHRMTHRGQARIKRLAREGYCNRCIGRELGFNRQEIRKWRRRLGIPAVPAKGILATCKMCVAKIRETTRRQCERLGVASLADVRSLAFRAYAVRHGWPDDLRPRAVQILNLLASRGPMTRMELAASLGLGWHGSRSSLKSKEGGSYLACLMKRGIVVCLQRANKVIGQGKGKSTNVYALSLTAERRFPDERPA